jgi:hypothetical protein
MELWTDVLGAEISNEPDSACMKWGGAHVFSLSRTRFPLWDLSSILEPRLENIDGTAPWMGGDQSAKG